MFVNFITTICHDRCIEKYKVTYTDTDNLIYHIKCDNVYEIIKYDISTFNTSDYAIDNAYSIPLANKKA